MLFVLKGAPNIITKRVVRRLITLFLAMCFVSATPLIQAKSDGNKSAAQAAKEAKARHGGKVVGVNSSGKNYKVKLIQKDGRVVTVTISGN